MYRRNRETVLKTPEQLAEEAEAEAEREREERKRTSHNLAGEAIQREMADSVSPITFDSWQTTCLFDLIGAYRGEGGNLP